MSRIRTLITACLAKQTLTKQYQCFFDGYEESKSYINSSFVECLYRCNAREESKKGDCANECLANPNKNIDTKCMTSCSSLNPIDQTQCFNSCRRRKRLAPLYDFTNAFELCSDFYDFAYQTDVANKDFIDVNGFATILRSSCSEHFKLIPLCQAFARNTVQKVVSLLQTTDSGESTAYCKALGFVE